MALVHEIRRRGRHILPPVLLAATLGYFGYHIIQGERGVLAWLQLEKELRIAQANVRGTARCWCCCPARCWIETPGRSSERISTPDHQDELTDIELIHYFHLISRTYPLLPPYLNRTTLSPSIAAQRV
jgi:hypothetical protein